MVQTNHPLFPGVPPTQLSESVMLAPVPSPYADPAYMQNARQNNGLIINGAPADLSTSSFGSTYPIQPSLPADDKRKVDVESRKKLFRILASIGVIVVIIAAIVVIIGLTGAFNNAASKSDNYNNSLSLTYSSSPFPSSSDLDAVSPSLPTSSTRLSLTTSARTTQIGVTNTITLTSTVLVSTPPPEVPFSIKHVASGRCINPVDGSANPANNAVAVLTDNCGANSKFTLTSGGSLRHSSGKCFHPLGGSANPPDNTEIVFYDVCDEARLQFTFTGTKLRHVPSGKCIHPLGGSANPTSGTHLVFYGVCDVGILDYNKSFSDKILNGSTSVQSLAEIGCETRKHTKYKTEKIVWFKTPSKKKFKRLCFEHQRNKYLALNHQTTEETPLNQTSTLQKAFILWTLALVLKGFGRTSSRASKIKEKVAQHSQEILGSEIKSWYVKTSPMWFNKSQQYIEVVAERFAEMSEFSEMLRAYNKEISGLKTHLSIILVSGEKNMLANDQNTINAFIEELKEVIELSNLACEISNQNNDEISPVVTFFPPTLLAVNSILSQTEELTQDDIKKSLMLLRKPIERALGYRCYIRQISQSLSSTYNEKFKEIGISLKKWTEFIKSNAMDGNSMTLKTSASLMIRWTHLRIPEYGEIVNKISGDLLLFQFGTTDVRTIFRERFNKAKNKLCKGKQELDISPSHSQTIVLKIGKTMHLIKLKKDDLLFVMGILEKKEFKSVDDINSLKQTFVEQVEISKKDRKVKDLDSDSNQQMEDSPQETILVADEEKAILRLEGELSQEKATRIDTFLKAKNKIEEERDELRVENEKLRRRIEMLIASMQPKDHGGDL
ncbi:hypothetical protein HK098_006084 [Nowakowskiella sp. JEL0407]|nr:hypothetical protein HK098_006084 [Nowakowskiella sp. JEL0407]